MRFWFVLAAVLATACGPADRFSGAAPSAADYGEAKIAAMEAAQAAPEAGAPPPPESAGRELTGAAAPLLAYEYGAEFDAPAAAVEPLMKLHEKACLDAGMQTCQVLASSSSGDADYRDARLEIRAAPAWLATFRAGLEGGAQGLGGRLRGQSVTSEDLSRQIVDTEARLAAQKTLRSRLQQILASRPGKLGELLETERELARVQGEIDSAESQLAVMRARVAMSRMTLSYTTRPKIVAASALQPIVDAATEFAYLAASGLAAIIRLIAFLLPWALVLGPAAWFGLRWRRRRLAAKAANAPGPAA